ncbi:MAG TPA: hypothetical protein VMU87_18230 [Stellaceae bacterium]|nr:hypothetical protein [Stellaceae bacterium]
MTKLRFAERRTLLRLAVAAVLMIGSGIALGWRAGQTDVPPAAPIAKEKWSVKPPEREDPTRDLSVLTSLHPWTGFVEARREQAAAHKAPPAWRLAGIVQRGEEKFALIAMGQYPKPIFEYRRVGDSLPDGSILVQITSDSAKTKMHSAPAPSSARTFPPSPASPPSRSAPPPSEARTYRLFEKK